MALTPLFAVPAGPELVIVLLIAILLFGANKIPKLARSTGQALGEFEKGKTQAEKELQNLRDGEGEGVDLDTGIASSSEGAADASQSGDASDAADAADETESSGSSSTSE